MIIFKIFLRKEDHLIQSSILDQLKRPFNVQNVNNEKILSVSLSFD